MKKRNVLFLLWLFCGVYYTASAFTVDAGEDQSVFVGATTVLGGSPTASDGKEPYSYTWTDVNGTVISNEANPMLTVVSGTNNYFVEVLDGNGISCIGEFVTVVGEANPLGLVLEEISFLDNTTVVDDDNVVSYTAPHFKVSTNETKPICYVSGQYMKVAGKINFNPGGGALPNLLIKGENSNGFSFSVNSNYTVNSNSIEFGATVANLLFTPNQVAYDEPFKIDWFVSLDGGTNWSNIGASCNQLYVTHKAPNSNLVGGVNPIPIRHTLLHIGCKASSGKNNLKDIVEGMFTEFDDKVVLKADNETRLTYYLSYNCNNYDTETLLSSDNVDVAPNGIKYADGQCGAFAKLFIDILKMQGIHNDLNYYSYVPTNSLLNDDKKTDNGFLVKNWMIPNNNGLIFSISDPNDDSILLQSYTHRNALRGGVNNDGSLFPYYQKDNEQAFDWMVEEVKDDPGIIGQGISSNPKSFFKNHQIVQIKTGDNIYKLYDPSYGIKFTNDSDIENKAIDGYIYSELKYVNENDPSVNCDCNKNGTISDLSVPCMVIYLRAKQSTTPVGITGVASQY